jgi:hypothetical protein
MVLLAQGTTAKPQLEEGQVQKHVFSIHFHKHSSPEVSRGY